jgi:hypothetical protein
MLSCKSDVKKMKSLEEIAREQVWQVPAFRATVRDHINQLSGLGSEARKQGQISRADDLFREVAELTLAWQIYSPDEEL